MFMQSDKEGTDLAVCNFSKRTALPGAEVRKISANISLSQRCYAHLSKCGNAILQRRVGAEERGQHATTKEGFDDAERRGGRGKRSRWNALVVSPQLLERTHQAIGLAHYPGPRFVCRELSLARKAELQQQCGERRQKKQQQTEDAGAATTISIVTAPAPKPRTPVRNPGDGTRKCRRDGTDQNIVVSNVRKFVSDDAFKLVIVHELQQTFGHGNGSMTRVPARCEGVRRGFRNYVQLRNRQVRFCREALHHYVEPRQLFPRNRPRAAGEQGNFVREKICERVRADRNSQAESHSVSPADVLAHQH